MSDQAEHVVRLSAARDCACDARLFVSRVQGAVNTGDISRAALGLCAFHLSESVRLLEAALGKGKPAPPAMTEAEMIAQARKINGITTTASSSEESK